MMETEQVKKLIEDNLPDSKAEIIDTTGTKDHFSAIIISSEFEGLSLVEQHQLVYKALGHYLTREIHALQLKTYSPSQWQQQNS